MTKKCFISLLLGLLALSMSSFAADGKKSTMEMKTETVSESNKKNQSTKKKRRRKKALMCKECGKPEVNCDCEGYEHNPDEN